MKNFLVGSIPGIIFVTILLIVNDLLYGPVNLPLWQIVLYGAGVLIAIEILVSVERAIKRKAPADR